MGNNVIAVWGSPSSGKTATSMKLARELEAAKKNVAVIFADLFCPVLSAVVPWVDIKNRTLGSLLSKPHIRQPDIMQAAIPCPNHGRVALIGYKNGDNIFTYSEYLAERVDQFISELRGIADFAIIDCSSVLTEDGFSTIALQKADRVLRLHGADLKSFSYFTSHLPLISRAKFKLGGHVNVLSNVKPGQEEGAFRSAYGGAAYTLPHVKALEQQSYSAGLLDPLCGRDAKKYNAEIKKMARAVFELE